MPKYKDKETAIKAIELLIANNMVDMAEMQLKENGIKATIRNGRIVDEQDVCEVYLDRFITVTQSMIGLKSDIRKLSTVNDEVLITGPTGTGKEILANALHGKRDGKFIACNASGLPEMLIESELFGHVRGAFTGAHADKTGLIRFATNGTFFLDEIGELSLEAQAKLLRAIQNRKIRKVGATEDLDVECRFVFATNRDLFKMVADGKFRADLLARISTFTIETLSLTDRPNDIIPIIKSMPHGDKFMVAMNGNQFPEAIFNVRTLEQWVKRHKVLGKLPS